MKIVKENERFYNQVTKDKKSIIGKGFLHIQAGEKIQDDLWKQVCGLDILS